MVRFYTEAADVHELIAAIAKIENKELSHVASEPCLTPKDERHQPAFSPMRENWRLSKVVTRLHR